MYLTIDQFQIVERDVQNEGITFSHLEYDLLDHVCCDIEDRMSKGLSFDNAYNSVKSDIGIQGLRRVQEETLLLINKNYRMMKKSMKTLGTIALASMSVAAVAKLMHWPGASTLMTLSFLAVSLFFFPAALYVWYKEVFNKKRAFIVILAFIGGFTFMAGTLFKLMHWPVAGILITSGEFFIILTIITGGINYLKSKQPKSSSNGILITGIIGLVLFLLGILFKLMHWPGAFTMLIFGTVLFFGIFLTVYNLNAYREEKSINKIFIFTVFAATIVITLSFLISTKFSSNILYGFIDYDIELQHSINITEKQINTIPESFRNSDEINLSANNLYNSITEIKKDLISITESKDIDVNNLKIDDIKYLKSFKLDENSYNKLIGKEKDGKIYMLFNDIHNYKSLLNKQEGMEYFYDGIISLKQENFSEWVKENFFTVPMIVTINNLSQLQMEIRLTQLESLTQDYKIFTEISKE